MRKYLRVISILIVCLILCGCELFGSSKQEVTFNYNCEGVDDYSCKIEDNKLNCMFTLPECSGKTFAGWYDAKTNGNPVNLDEDFTESKVIYAQWKEDQKLDSETPIEPTTPDNPSEPTTPETPIEPTTPDNPSEPEKPTPIIETIKYKVNFNTNGGVGGQTSAVEVKYKEMMPTISSTIPTRSNYTFMGWYDNSDYTKGKVYYNEKCEATKYYDREEDITLYAGWKEKPKPVEPTPEVVKYTISFNINSGTGTLPKDISIEYNATLPNINSSSPTRTGYEFIGWYDNSDYTKGNKYYSTDGKPVRTYNRKSDITLYAGWKIRTYSITYNLNDGSGGQTGSLSVQYNSALPTISKSRPTRSGFTFKGWYDNADYTKGKQYYNENNVAVRAYDKTSNLTLYAGWSKVVVVQTYQVTFNINGGSGTTPGRVNAVLGSAMPSITSNVPSRTDYTFMGWYDNTDYTKGTQYYTNKNVSARNYDKTSGITLYAGWKSNEIKCTITYNANGGSGAPGAQTYTYATSGTINLSSTVPTRSGFIFLGWATSSSATIAKYSAGQSWNKSNKGNYTLYAVWGSSLKIYYLSLGRYDGFLIMGNGTTLFIDGGDPSPGHKCVEFLQNMGITKIDGLIGSHLHYNHIAAHEEIIDNFNVKAVYYPDDPRTCKERKTCKDSAVKPDGLIPKLNNIQVNVVTPQMNYKIGNLEFDILSPFDLNGSTNDNSLNMILKYGSHKFYFTGDTGTSVLKKIYQTYNSSVYENISIFKHPHHGQNEVPSSLIKAMKPQYVIVPNNTKSLAGSEYKSVKSTVYELNNNKGGYVLAESDGTTLKVTDMRKP